MNMSYCRFHNTLLDLQACLYDLEERGGIEIEYYFNGNRLPEGFFGMDFEIRMILPLNPVKL